MIKNIFKSEPIDIIDIVDNERYLYYEIIELKNEIIKLKENLKGE